MKKKIPKEDGILKYVCNESFYAVKNILPKSIRDSDKYNNYLAFMLGASAGFGVAEVGSFLINISNENGVNLPLEKIASYSLTATVSTPVISYLISPKKVKEFINENPVYSSGVAGVMTGASLKAILALY